MATKVERISRARCSYVSWFKAEQGVVLVLDKPLNKGWSGGEGRGGDGARSSAAPGRWLPSTPSCFPDCCYLPTSLSLSLSLSIGIAIFVAGHDSFIPVTV